MQITGISSLALGVLLTACCLGSGVRKEPVPGADTGIVSESANEYRPVRRYGCTLFWSGEELLVWGGMGNSASAPAFTATDAFEAYSPRTRTWRALRSVNGPGPRSNAGSALGNKSLLFYGGLSGTPRGRRNYLHDCRMYDLETDTWSEVDGDNLPGDQVLPYALFIKGKFIIWRSGSENGSGGIYDPVLKTWRAFSLPDTFSISASVPVGTDDGMFILSDDFTKIALYYPAQDAWNILDIPVPLEPRYGYKIIQSGNLVIVYGGYSTIGSGEDETSKSWNDGAAFNLDTKTWIPFGGMPGTPQIVRTMGLDGNDLILWIGPRNHGGDGRHFGFRLDIFNNTLESIPGLDSLTAELVGKSNLFNFSNALFIDGKIMAWEVLYGFIYDIEKDSWEYIE